MTILNDKEEGVDYFPNEDDVKEYARIHLGWKSHCTELRVESPKDAELADRVKKSNPIDTFKNLSSEGFDEINAAESMEQGISLEDSASLEHIPQAESPSMPW
eukprot:CAMPEP_0183718680 /NCGR_PEP_ID=MMETSP0737-20130205/11879_1 /TAXON_ID=385413 /ORGANISM="Thalassiosira miniscula, Strain CCMP1093" /LENGTH=102 /DNA_ID=CAMNT_0025948287 /DNA_START=90 /DNA_END=395 /DNA_ORIENTATION=+